MTILNLKKAGTCLLIIGFILIVKTHQSPQQKIIETSSLNKIANEISKTKNNTIVFLDIDDTIITPKSKTLRTKPYKSMIDDIKKNRDRYPNFEDIISHWRLSRKVMLLDTKWPDIIKSLKKTFKVFALTSMDIGKCGSIESIEKWRYQELKNFDIMFSEDQEIPSFENNGFSFYKGIFFTGKHSKSQTINNYFKNINTKTIVLVDDRKENLEDVMHFCKKHDLNFIGLLYTVSNTDIQTNEKLAIFQKEYLIQHAIWLEDDDALYLLNKHP